MSVIFCDMKLEVIIINMYVKYVTTPHNDSFVKDEFIKELLGKYVSDAMIT